MSEKAKDGAGAKERAGPRLSEAAKAAKAERELRLAEALRANLKKRKAQVRGRGEEPR